MATLQCLAQVIPVAAISTGYASLLFPPHCKFQTPNAVLPNQLFKKLLVDKVTDWLPVSCRTRGLLYCYSSVSSGSNTCHGGSRHNDMIWWWLSANDGQFLKGTCAHVWAWGVHKILVIGILVRGTFSFKGPKTACADFPPPNRLRYRQEEHSVLVHKICSNLRAYFICRHKHTTF